MLADLVLESAESPGRKRLSGPLFHLSFAADYPVVAVGAPASTFFPEAAGRLSLELKMPENAEVANAFGAVMGSVVQRTHVTVTQPVHGTFIVHGDQGPQSFNDLGSALTRAEELAMEKVRVLCSSAGAGTMEVRISRDENHVHHDLDGDLFLETRITATATGRPDCLAMTAIKLN
jgi:N-methylhydantoinase A/oxoprolinase/acetone carboxylase beta subunit